MCAVGNADQEMAAKVRAVFEKRCIELLEWACVTLKREKCINADWGEENITANLYVLNGVVDGVVNAINARLSTKNRNSEILSMPIGNQPWMVCQSLHIDKENQKVKIVHYLFDFS